MSAAALYVVLRHLLGFGASVVHAGRPDEGLEAHIWQIMMAGQLPVITLLRDQMAAQRSAGHIVGSGNSGTRNRSGSGTRFSASLVTAKRYYSPRIWTIRVTRLAPLSQSAFHISNK
jgi:hypothetical protein